MPGRKWRRRCPGAVPPMRPCVPPPSRGRLIPTPKSGPRIDVECGAHCPAYLPQRSHVSRDARLTAKGNLRQPEAAGDNGLLALEAETAVALTVRMDTVLNLTYRSRSTRSRRGHAEFRESLSSCGSPADQDRDRGQSSFPE